MWRFVFVLALAACSSGDDFQVPPAPDGRILIDLAVSLDHPPEDLSCFNLACGGCSTWARPDGTPVVVGDPCLISGQWQCTGVDLTCSSTACLSCPQTVTGTVCGADGHSIIELLHNGATCSAYDFHSAISTCNHNPADKCTQRCQKDPGGGSYSCAAHCLSDDGGVTGFDYSAAATCLSLSM